MNTGGAETFLMKMYRSLDREKYQMDFCVNSDKNFYEKEILEMGGTIYKIPAKFPSMGINTLSVSVSILWPCLICLQLARAERNS